MGRWRITSVVSIVLSGESSIYLFDAKARSVVQATLKATNGIELITDLQEIKEVKIECGEYNENPYTHIFIKHEMLPKKESWYLVENFYTPMLREIIENCTITKGITSGDFSIIMSNNFDKIALVPENSENYDEYLDETIRSISLENGERTTKWIPGHRYNTPDDTSILLGKVKNKLTNSDNWLIVKKIKPGETRKEILEEGKEEIFILESLPSYVDTGKVIEDINEEEEYLNIEDYYASLLISWGKDSKKIDYIINVLSLYSKDEIKLGKLLKDLIKSYLVWFIELAIIDLWKMDRGIDENTPIEISYSKVLARILDPFSSIDINKRLELLKSLGFNIKKLLKETLNSWRPDDFSKSFVEFIKHINYFRRSSSSNKVIDNTILGNAFTKGGNRFYYITSEYGYESRLTAELINIIREAENNYGVSDCEYERDFTGKITIKIDIENILKRYKSIEDIPVNLKNDIIKHQFCSLVFKYRIE